MILLGTTTGYALIYGSGGLQLTRITAEAGTIIMATPIVLSVANDYGLRFTGDGSSLMGEVFDLAAPGVPLATVSATDSTYASGVPGIFVYDGSGAASTTARATFDNFSAQVPEPSAFLLTTLGGLLCIGSRRRAIQG